MSTGDVEPYTEALAQIHDNTGCGQCETTVDGAHECSDEVFHEPLTFPAYRNEAGYGPGGELHHCYNESTVKQWIKAKVEKNEYPTDPHTRARWVLPTELIPAEEIDDGDDGENEQMDGDDNEETSDEGSDDGSDIDTYQSTDHVDGADPNTIRQMMEGVVISSQVFNICDIMELMNTNHDFMARNLFDITIDFPQHDVHGESYQGLDSNSLEVLITSGIYPQAKRYVYRTLASTTQYSVKNILYLHSVGLINEARHLFNETLSCAETFDVDAIIQLYHLLPDMGYTAFRETLWRVRYGAGFDPVPVVKLKKCGMGQQAIELFDATSHARG